MKIRNFKKAIRRAGRYKYIVPRIFDKINGWDDCKYVHFTCGKLRALLCLEDGKFACIKVK